MSLFRKLLAGHGRAIGMSLILQMAYAPLLLGVPVFKLFKVEDPQYLWIFLSVAGLFCLLVSPFLVLALSRAFGFSYRSMPIASDPRSGLVAERSNPP